MCKMIHGIISRQALNRLPVATRISLLYALRFNGHAEQRDQLASVPGIELTESDADINIEPSGSGYHLLVFQDTLGRVADFAALQESLRRRVILETGVEHRL